MHNLYIKKTILKVDKLYSCICKHTNNVGKINKKTNLLKKERDPFYFRS